MLKDLSSLNYEMFCKILNNQSISKEKVDFNSLQEEIYNNLLSEFISPIEREDIFILQKRLEEEFLEICSFSLLKSKEKNFSEEICSLLKDNVIVISELKNFKTPKKLLKLIRENKNYAKNILSIREKSEIIKSIYKIDIEIERIILSNN
jgi:uncharacterized protein Yka (UPF0111/DUF47 family)